MFFLARTKHNVLKEMNPSSSRGQAVVSAVLRCSVSSPPIYFEKDRAAPFPPCTCCWCLTFRSLLKLSLAKENQLPQIYDFIPGQFVLMPR